VACGQSRANPRINMDRAANFWWKNMVYDMEYHFMVPSRPSGHQSWLQNPQSTQFLDFGSIMEVSYEDTLISSINH
jgi:hypothetical protein